MAVLRVDHPDVMEFIEVKQDLKELQNFNLSVGITEKFMEAVRADGEYDLINPRNVSGSGNGSGSGAGSGSATGRGTAGAGSGSV